MFKLILTLAMMATATVYAQTEAPAEPKEPNENELAFVVFNYGSGSGSNLDAFGSNLFTGDSKAWGAGGGIRIPGTSVGHFAMYAMGDFLKIKNQESTAEIYGSVPNGVDIVKYVKSAQSIGIMGQVKVLKGIVALNAGILGVHHQIYRLSAEQQNFQAGTRIIPQQVFVEGTDNVNAPAISMGVNAGTKHFRVKYEFRKNMGNGPVKDLKFNFVGGQVSF